MNYMYDSFLRIFDSIDLDSICSNFFLLSICLDLNFIISIEVYKLVDLLIN